VLADDGSAESSDREVQKAAKMGSTRPGLVADAPPVGSGRPPTLKERLKAARKQERREQRAMDALLDADEEREMEGAYPVEVSGG
jgi:hypothetical protein